MSGFKERLQRLEAQLPKPLVIVGRMPNGTECKMTADEFTSSKTDFVKVASGSSLRDLEKVLDSFGGII